MIVWGGQNANGYLNSGGRYNPRDGQLGSHQHTNAPEARYSHSGMDWQ